MASKPKWAIVDVDKLDQIFTLMDKVNRAAGFGMLTPEDKTAVVDKLKDEGTDKLEEAAKDKLKKLGL